ncbi:entry exclusion lipoprotein TrbK [Gilliamella sp. B2894]|uniref:entry exclusion lipoprotein TrbK n=1 Tax=Gilliamella sp. B2894 TaxID=2817978 RepID=UPI00226A5CDA|nr:entry exclusion lipoprotein TrbK [Gilliamella sp. B2894]MCX8657368.1 entry exclusion lipoprotein TrbK [Gilliamella sp. B2894]
MKIKGIILAITFALSLTGCNEKPKNYECSDYYSITDTKIKAELEQRCPRLGGNFTPSESKGGMLEF